MLNEGILVSDTKIAMKSLMLRVLWRLGRTDPETWERYVFRELTLPTPATGWKKATPNLIQQPEQWLTQAAFIAAMGSAN